MSLTIRKNVVVWRTIMAVRRKTRNQKRIERIIKLSIVTLFGVAMLCLLCHFLGTNFDLRTITSNIQKTKQVAEPERIQDFLTPNEYSRPQVPLEKVKGVVIHYTANPGSDAAGNRNYFEGLKDSKITKASSHFIIGLDGTIIQCLPLEEIAYASNKRNVDTIAIECCHPDETGKFTKETYHSLIQLTAWLCGRYNLKKDDIIRHYDVTGKDCPRYYVAHEDKWEELKDDVFNYIEDNFVLNDGR